MLGEATTARARSVAIRRPGESSCSPRAWIGEAQARAFGLFGAEAAWIARQRGSVGGTKSDTAVMEESEARTRGSRRLRQGGPTCRRKREGEDEQCGVMVLGYSLGRGDGLLGHGGSRREWAGGRRRAMALESKATRKKMEEEQWAGARG